MQKTKNHSYVIIAIVYLLGLFMGALDTGIVTPARTVIQNCLNVEDQLGVWMLTIYTLSYAVSIPIMGKFADKYGRKYVYLICVFLFGLGSLICGLSSSLNNFWILIIGRAIQAFGGGGIVPVATAEFGTAFPEEKRGMALGLVGGVYGIANVFGSSAGSLIMDVFGHQNWQFIFYINVPICIFILIAGIAKLPNSKAENVEPIDWAGIILLTGSILSLLYGLKNIDFFDLINSIQSADVYPFLLIFIVLLPIFIFVEKKSKDPVMNLFYFKNGSIVITLICSLCTGIIMMATVFLPQFCENATFMASGSGGYYIIILGVFAGLGSPMSGKMIDKIGVKPVLGLGFIMSAAGSAYLAFVACPMPNVLNVIISLVLLGFGMGFTMGTPLNYMMLQKTDDSESNSALATLSLVRSIGTAIAPAIMVAFIAHAGMGMQDTLMDAMPKEVKVTPLPYAQELDQKLEEMKNDKNSSEMLEGLDIPKLSDFETIEIDNNNTKSENDEEIEISDETIEQLESSDVTTIVDSAKLMTSEMFSKIKPKAILDATNGINQGIDSMKNGLNEMTTAINDMQKGKWELNSNISTMNSKIAEMDSKISEMEKGKQSQQEALAKMNIAKEMASKIPGSEVPDTSKLENSISEMDKGIEGIQQGKSQMQKAVRGMKTAYSNMNSGLKEIQASKDELNVTIQKLETVRDAIPLKFDEAEIAYIAEIDNNSYNIMKLFQSTLNSGFYGMFIFAGCASIIGFVLLLFYKDEKNSNK